MATEQFIRSQIDYYTRHLGSGNSHDRNMIVGLKHYYEGLLRKHNAHDIRLADYPPAPDTASPYPRR